MPPSALPSIWIAFISISGDPASRFEELARIAAQRLKSELVTDARLLETIAGPSYT